MADGGLRFIVLVNQLQISRDSLRSALGALTKLNLIMKNPGYGHPMRPEYVLTESGKLVAEQCHRLLHLQGLTPVTEKKWSAPVIFALATECSRFNEIRAFLGITPRALTLALRHLVDEGYVIRIIDDGYPPASRYALSRSAKNLTQRISDLYHTLTD